MNTLKLKPGKYGYARKPVLHLNVEGKPYLWIGNNEEFEDPLCYATFSGPRSMEKFAKAILNALKPKKRNGKALKQRKTR